MQKGLIADHDESELQTDPGSALPLAFPVQPALYLHTLFGIFAVVEPAVTGGVSQAFVIAAGDLASGNANVPGPVAAVHCDGAPHQTFLWQLELWPGPAEGLQDSTWFGSWLEESGVLERIWRVKVRGVKGACVKSVAPCGIQSIW